jgi:hypothetical protein
MSWPGRRHVPRSARGSVARASATPERRHAGGVERGLGSANPIRSAHASITGQSRWSPKRPPKAWKNTRDQNGHWCLRMTPWKTRYSRGRMTARTSAMPLGLFVGQRTDQALRVTEGAHAEEPKRTGGEGVAVSGDEAVGLRRPGLVVDRRAEHHRVVGVERLDLVDVAQVDGGAAVDEAGGDAGHDPLGRSVTAGVDDEDGHGARIAAAERGRIGETPAYRTVVHTLLRRLGRGLRPRTEPAAALHIGCRTKRATASAAVEAPTYEAAAVMLARARA